MKNDFSRTSFTAHKNDSADKWILGLAFLIGITGSLALKVLGLPVWVPAVFAGAIIIVYAVLAHIIPTIQLESDQVGDNAYYLGFVLTLTSLSFTLYELGQHGGDADFIAYVIAGFGVALSSTIVGVAVRVFCLQFRLDLVARDREARLTLNDAMRRFRTELTDVIRGTKYLGVEIRQSLLEYHEDLAKSHKEATRNLNKDLIIAFKEALEPLNSQLATLMQQVFSDAQTTVNASGEARDAALRATTAGLTVASQSISDELQKVTVAIKRTLNDGVVSMASSAEAVSLHANHTTQLLEQQRASTERILDEASKSTSDTINSAMLKASDMASSAAKKSAEGISAATSFTLASLESFHAASQALVQQLQRQAEELAAMKLAAQQTETQSAAAIEEALQQMRELSVSIAQHQKLQLAAFESILEQHRTLTRNLTPTAAAAE